MYVKLIMSGNIGGSLGLESIETVNFLDSSSVIIPLSYSNIISWNYDYGCNTTSLSNLVLDINGAYSGRAVPGLSNNSGGTSTGLLILYSTANVAKILLQSTSATYAAKYVDIYTSPNNITYTFISRTTFTTSSQTIISNLPISKYLIKQYSAYYSIKPAYYDINAKQYIPLTLAGGLVPNKADIDLYGFDNLANITSSVTVGTETFKPIDKLLSSFQLKEYKAK